MFFTYDYTNLVKIMKTVHEIITLRYYSPEWIAFMWRVFKGNCKVINNHTPNFVKINKVFP